MEDKEFFDFLVNALINTVISKAKDIRNMNFSYIGANGEVIGVKNNGQLVEVKVADGVTPYSNLPYLWSINLANEENLTHTES